ncbi:MAG: hypothetical protein ABEI78_02030 [Candidatus Nanohaloarchaea archaeon]
MGIEKFYRTVRKKFGLEKEQMKQELREEVTEELKDEFDEEISYIEAQMREYEQLVAEINHLLSVMRKERIKGDQEKERVKMEEMENMEPLKSKLKELEKSMKDRMNKNEAFS